ncbi:MAG: monovalent cation/H(+) antiporter subunit G [Planctomycetes bacterium]|nr:monovalent cation/H(+) antiporter subunit G [Planctomycetota bacterium]
MLVEILSWFCFLAGGFLCISGSVGILRLPDFFSRLHASSVTETLATPLLLTGVMLQTGWSLDTLKLMMVWLFVLATNPTATHAMVKAALHDGQTPLEFDQPEGTQTDDNESTEEESSTS